MWMLPSELQLPNELQTVIEATTNENDAEDYVNAADKIIEKEELEIHYQMIVGGCRSSVASVKSRSDA